MASDLTGPLTCETNGSLICEHNCTNLYEGKGFACTCYKGYGLHKVNSTDLVLSDGRPESQNIDIRRHTCIDIDECLNYDSHCPQKCVNEKGSYKCECAENYIDTRGDGSVCEARSADDSVVLIAYGDEIRQLRQNISNRLYSTLVDKQVYVHSIDVDAMERHAYWIDEQSNLIYRSYIPVSRTSVGHVQNLTAFETSHSRNQHEPTTLSVDWLAKNIYFADHSDHTIKVATSDGRYIKTLVRTNAKIVHSLVVNPTIGFVTSIITSSLGIVSRALFFYIFKNDVLD
jgi:hypothetical protein